MNKYILAILISSCFINMPAYSADKEIRTVQPALSVNVTSPVSKSMIQQLKLTGNVSAWQESGIGSELSGYRVEEIYVDIGHSVKKGQLLAKLNSSTLSSDLEQAKANSLDAEANHIKAKDNLERAKTLEHTDALSPQQFKEYVVAEMSARAKLNASLANIKSIQTRLKQTQIISPDDGLISARNISIGNIASQADMFKLIRKERLQWLPSVSTDLLMNIKIGQLIKIKVNNIDLIDATVSEIGPSVDSTTRQGNLIVHLAKEQHKGKLKQGMFIEGYIDSTPKTVLTVPQQAVLLRDGFNYVMTVKDNRIVKKRITTGIKQGTDVEIITGITKDDILVTTGTTFLNDGDLVKIVK